MNIATHIIRIKGKFDKDIWTEEKLEKYVRSKIRDDITSFYHADLELFGIDEEVINVWVFVSVLPSNVTRDIIDKWLINHIKEEGIAVTDFEIEEIFNLLHPKNVFVTII
jgi:hypothetical protein